MNSFVLKSKSWYMLPIEYANENKSFDFIDEILKLFTEKELVEMLSFKYTDQATVASYIFHSFKSCNSKILLHDADDIHSKILPLIPELDCRVKLEDVPLYHPLTYKYFKDEFVHPLAIYLDSNAIPKDVKQLFNFFFSNTKSKIIQENLKQLIYQIVYDIKPFCYSFIKSVLPAKLEKKIIQSNLDKWRCEQRVYEFFNEHLKLGLSLPKYTYAHPARFELPKLGIKLKIDYIKMSEKVIQEVISEERELFKKTHQYECQLNSEEDFEKDCYVLRDDSIDPPQYYDAFITKLDVTKTYYGKDSFYSMQLLRDDGKNLYILWNRWGRTGSTGEFQRTPFKTYEEARVEFCKLFKKKFKIPWEAMRTDKNIYQAGLDVEIEYTKLIKPLDYDSIPMRIDERFKHLLKPIMEMNELIEEIEEFHYSYDTILTSPLHKDAVNSALKLLEQISSKVKEAEKFKTDQNYDDYKVRMNQILALNNQYLRVLPRVSHCHISVMTTESLANSERKGLTKMILLGESIRRSLAAYHHQDMVNPIDYVMQTLQTPVRVVEKSESEYDLIMRTMNAVVQHHQCYVPAIYEIEDTFHTKSTLKAFENKRYKRMCYLFVSQDTVRQILYQNCDVRLKNIDGNNENFKFLLIYGFIIAYQTVLLTSLIKFYKVEYNDYNDNPNTGTIFEFREEKLEIDEEDYILFVELAYDNMVNIIDNFWNKLISKGSQGKIQGFNDNTTNKSQSKKTVDLIRCCGKETQDWSHNYVHKKYLYLETTHQILIYRL